MLIGTFFETRSSETILLTQTPAIVFGAVWAIKVKSQEIAEHKTTNSRYFLFMFLNAFSTIYRKQGSWLCARNCGRCATTILLNTWERLRGKS